MFYRDYLREHVTHGYAITVHSAQGVTADTTHAVLGETTTRTLLYVAMTRGRDTNTAYLYERIAEHEYQPGSDASAPPLWRGDPHGAAQTLRELIARTGEAPVTAHDYATRTASSALPTTVQHLMQRREMDTHRRLVEYQASQQETRAMAEESRPGPFQACQPQSQRQ